VNPNTIRRIGLAGFIALGVLWGIAWFLAPPKHPSVPFNGGVGVLWKTTGYRMDDGWGINLGGLANIISYFADISSPQPERQRAINHHAIA
jgi:hypothetical protein